MDCGRASHLVLEELWTVVSRGAVDSQFSLVSSGFDLPESQVLSSDMPELQTARRTTWVDPAGTEAA